MVANRNQHIPRALKSQTNGLQEYPMNSIIYLVGLVVIVIAILSFIGLA